MKPSIVLQRCTASNITITEVLYLNPNLVQHFFYCTINALLKDVSTRSSVHAGRFIVICNCN